MSTEEKEDKQTLLRRIAHLEGENQAKDIQLGFQRDIQTRFTEQLNGREQRLLAAEKRVEESAQSLLKEVSNLAKVIVEAFTAPEKLKAYKDAIKDSRTVEVSDGR